MKTCARERQKHRTYGTVGNRIYRADWPCMQEATVRHLWTEMTKNINERTPKVIEND